MGRRHRNIEDWSSLGHSLLLHRLLHGCLHGRLYSEHGSWVLHLHMLLWVRCQVSLKFVQLLHQSIIVCIVEPRNLDWLLDAMLMLLGSMTLEITDAVNVVLELSLELLSSISFIIYPAFLLANSVLETADLILSVGVGT